MARHRKPSEPMLPPGASGGDFDIQAWVGELIAGRGPAEIRELLQGLLADAPRAAGPPDPPNPAAPQAPLPAAAPAPPRSSRHLPDPRRPQGHQAAVVAAPGAGLGFVSR